MRLPQLHDDLVQAAGRRSRRRLPRARSLGLGVAFTVLAAGSAGAVMTGVVGGRPSLFAQGPGPAPEEGIEITRGKVVLGTGRLPEAGRWELVGYRQRRRGRGPDDLCLDVVLVDRGIGYGCGNPTVRTQGISGGASGTMQLTGATTRQEVASVRVRFRLKRRREAGVRSASLVKVPARVAALVGFAEAFSFYVAELPPAAEELEAEALDDRGRRVWTAPYCSSVRPC
ncbi:MAG: hypothetical protein M3P50_08885 [Actinomycetota bacterium]|nr:hypothetical protein [Actinomycetota bacterium]